MPEGASLPAVVVGVEVVGAGVGVGASGAAGAAGATGAAVTLPRSA